jgi:hypothetical protein
MYKSALDKEDQWFLKIKRSDPLQWGDNHKNVFFKSGVIQNLLKNYWARKTLMNMKAT